MIALKNLSRIVTEKKVGDEEYFITYYEHSGKKRVPSRIELYTEKAYKTHDAAERALEKFKNDIGNSRDDDTDAADEERDLLDDCSITRGAILKRDHPKLFEGATFELMAKNGSVKRFQADSRDAAIKTAKAAKAKSLIKCTRDGLPIGKPISLSEAKAPNPAGTEAWQAGYDDAKSSRARDGKQSQMKKYMNNPALMKKYEDGSREFDIAMKRKAKNDANPITKEAQDSKGREIKAGDRLLWVDGNGEHTGTVSADPKFNGGLKVDGRSVKNIIDDADKVTVLKEARSIPAWFKDGAKVKMMPEYADKDKDEVFTLKSVDEVSGKGRVADNQGKGWNISYHQVYPKNKTPAIHESADEKLTSEKAEKEGNVWLVKFTHCPGKTDTRDYSIRSVKAITSAQAVATAKAKLPADVRDCAKVSDVKMTDEAVKEADEGNMTFTKKDDGKVGKFGVKVGQIYVPADGSKNELKVLSINHATEDALVFDKVQNKERHIDLFKLAKVRYSLKEDAALQGLGKSLSGKAAASDGVDVPMDDDASTDDVAPPSDTEVTGDADDQQTPAEFKVGDVVKTLVGPHKGEEHDVVKVYPDGRVDLKPKGLEGTAVKYRNGGVTAKPDQVVLAESILRGTKSLLRTITIDLTEGGMDRHRAAWRQAKKDRVGSADEAEAARERQKKHDAEKGKTPAKVTAEGKNDTMMPLSYKPAKGHKIEAYGRKGMKNTMWRKYFKDGDAMSKWCEDNDATVEGSRDLEKDELR